MIIKVLLDEDSGSAELVTALERSQVAICNQIASFNVSRVVDVGLQGANDDVILTYAGEEGRLVVTRNPSDFYNWARVGLNVGGICFTVRPHRSDYRVAHAICNAAIVLEGNFAGEFIDLAHYEAYPLPFGVRNDEA